MMGSSVAIRQRTQVAGEEELGVSIPTVLERNIGKVILNVVRIWKD
jgi:hypothetical protein